MTLIQILLLIVGIFVVGSVAYWVITKFFSAPVQPIALGIVGLLLLLLLLAQFFPEASGIRIWR